MCDAPIVWDYLLSGTTLFIPDFFELFISILFMGGEVHNLKKSIKINSFDFVCFPQRLRIDFCFIFSFFLIAFNHSSFYEKS